MIPTSSSLFGRGSPSGDPGSTLAFFLFMFCLSNKKFVNGGKNIEKNPPNAEREAKDSDVVFLVLVVIRGRGWGHLDSFIKCTEKREVPFCMWE